MSDQWVCGGVELIERSGAEVLAQGDGQALAGGG